VLTRRDGAPWEERRWTENSGFVLLSVSVRRGEGRRGKERRGEERREGVIFLWS